MSEPDAPPPVVAPVVAPERGRTTTRRLAWTGWALAAGSLLGTLWFPLAAAAALGLVALAQASARRRWDDVRTRRLVVTGVLLAVVALLAGLAAFVYRAQHDSTVLQPVEALEEGTCVTDIHRLMWQPQARVIRCGLEHEGFVAYVKVWTGSARPGADDVRAQTLPECSAQLTRRYPQLARDNASPLVARVFYPLDDDEWAQGQRTSVCLVSREDGAPLVGPSEDEIDSAVDHDAALAR